MSFVIFGGVFIKNNGNHGRQIISDKDKPVHSHPGFSNFGFHQFLKQKEEEEVRHVVSGILSSLQVSYLFIKKTNQKGQSATLKPGHAEYH